MAHNTIAVIADCDDTLAPDTTAQLLTSLGITPKDFYEGPVGKLVDEGWDPTLAYLHELIRQAPVHGLTRAKIQEVGEGLRFYPGIPDAFPKLRRQIEDDPRYKPYDIKVEFYVITGGIEEMLSASPLRKEVNWIWGCNFAYDSDGRVAFPRNVVSFTEKTRFVFNIQKGLVGDQYVNKPYAVNEPMEEEERRIPLRNMIYVGDGPSDIPCMSLLQDESYIIGILSKENPYKSWALGYGRRADITVPPDFREGEHGYIHLCEVLKQVAERIRSDFEYQRAKRATPKY